MQICGGAKQRWWYIRNVRNMADKRIVTSTFDVRNMADKRIVTSHFNLLVSMNSVDKSSVNSSCASIRAKI